MKKAYIWFFVFVFSLILFAPTVDAQLSRRMMLAASGESVRIVFQAFTADPADQQTYTFSAQALGAPAANRQIVVAIFGLGAANPFPVVSSMTVGGISGSEVATQVNTNERVSIWAASVPTGTAGDIVIDLGDASSRCGIGVWAMYGAATTAHDTLGSAANPMTGTIDIPAHGAVIATAVEGTTATFTWTGLTEDFDEPVELASTPMTGASKEFPSAETGYTITATPTASAQPAMAAASWGLP